MNKIQMQNGPDKEDRLSYQFFVYTIVNWIVAIILYIVYESPLSILIVLAIAAGILFVEYYVFKEFLNKNQNLVQ